MTDTIEPALNERHWQSVQNVSHERPFIQSDGSVAFLAGECGTANMYAEVQPDELPSFIAICNHALHDGDPHKLTEKMVIVMTSAAHFLENQKGGELSTHWPDDANPWRALAGDLRRYAESLRSLLPPRGGA